MVFLQPDRFWAGFCERIGLPELATDERFVPSSNLIANAEEACALVGQRLASEDLDHWRKALADEPGVWAALATPKETLNDPQVKPNGYTVPNVDDEGQRVSDRRRASAIQRNRSAAARAPEQGQHTEEILLELDLDWDDISAAQGQRRDSLKEPMMERRELGSVIYEREPPIARIILNRPDKANTKDATLVEEVDACLRRGRPRQGDQGRDPQGQRQGVLRRPCRQVGARREPVPGLRGHVRGPVQGTPVPVADAVPVGVPEADDLGDPRLLHGRRDLSRAAHRFQRRIRGRVLPDAACTEPRRAGRAHHDRAMAADELASRWTGFCWRRRFPRRRRSSGVCSTRSYRGTNSRRPSRRWPARSARSH